MRHPTEGVLRRLLDEPAGVSDTDRGHVAGCSRCLDALAAVRADAAAVSAALATGGAADVDTAAAWQRLSASAAGAEPRRAAAAPRADRFRSLLRRPAVAVMAVAVVLAGAGTAAANNWLQIFRTEQIATVDLTTADLVALPDLTAYGEVDVHGDGVHEVPDAATAAAETGLDVPEVSDLPRGVGGAPVYRVSGEMSATFVFSAERAARAAAGAGRTLPPPPPGMDGSRVRLVAGPGVAGIWTQSTGMPVLLVGRAVAPRAFAAGLPFEAVRDYLLSLPGLPADVAAQLRGFAADGSTLPLPVPSDRVTTSSAEVNGAPATVLATRDRSMAAVVWVTGGVVTAVVGALDSDEVLSIARDLR